MMPLYGQKKLFGTSCLDFFIEGSMQSLLIFQSSWVFTKRGEIRKILAYKNSTDNVKCIRCNGNAELWNPSKGCPICGNILEKQDDCMILAD